MISEKEDVVRLLSKDWIVDGQLLQTAFALRYGETYISVNRPAISSFKQDITSFLLSHPLFCFGTNSDEYCSAKISVKDIRDIKVALNDTKTTIDVKVEPRDTRIKSHAGIFIQYEGKNLKQGSFLSMKKDISADDILLKIRYQLTSLATVEHKKLKD